MNTLIIYYLAGIIVAFSPCLFPVLPTFLTYISAKKSARSRAFIASLLFSLGLTLSFITYSLMGVFAKELIMPLLTLSLENIVTSFGVLLIALGISMFTPFKDIMSRISAPTLKLKRSSLLDALVLGFLFSLLAAPCAAGSILAIVAGVILTSSGEFMSALITAVIQILFYSMGASTPFIILGALTQGISKKIHRRLSKSFLVKYNEPIMGILLIIYGIATLWSVGNFLVYLEFANIVLDKVSNFSWIILWMYFAYSIFRVSRFFNDRLGILLFFSILFNITLLFMKIFIPTSILAFEYVDLLYLLSKFLFVFFFSYTLISRTKKSSIAHNGFISVMPLIFIKTNAFIISGIIDIFLVFDFIFFYIISRKNETRWLALGIIIYVLYSYHIYVLNIFPYPYNELIKSLFFAVYFAFSSTLFPISQKNIATIKDIEEIYEI